LNYRNFNNKPLERDEYGSENRPYMKDIRDLECFTPDIEDPVQFQMAFFKVYSPAEESGDKWVDYRPSNYQIAISRDESELIVVNKARQTGISVSTVLDHIHRAWLLQPYLALFLSVKQDQANELIKKAKDMVNYMAPGFRFKMANAARQMIEFENGNRLKAISAAPESGRSFTGDVVLDEFAFVPNDEEIMTAIMQTTVLGGHRVRMISTPNGDRGIFAAISKACKAVQKGIATTEQEKLAGKWSLHTIHWSECDRLTKERVLDRCTTREMYLQEYCCQFLDETSSMLSREVLDKATDPNLKQWNIGQLIQPKGRVFFGIDPGERINPTGFVVSEEINNKWYIRHVHAQKMTPEAQAEYTKSWWNTVRPTKIYVDGTGPGNATLNFLRNPFAGFVEDCQLMQALKEKLVYSMIGLFDNEQVVLPKNDLIWYQLHNLERKFTPEGKSTFTGKVKGDNDDVCWATVLALAHRWYTLAPLRAEAAQRERKNKKRKRKRRKRYYG
jgi:phage FluMu gp28-like protein